MKISFKNLLIVFLSTILIFLLVNKKENTYTNLDELEITYIDVGQGNAVLVKTKDKSLLIDGEIGLIVDIIIPILKIKNLKKKSKLKKIF